MSGTTLDITLSAKEQTELSHKGIFAYAEYFGNNEATALDTPVTLVNNGTVENGGTVALQLTDGSDVLNGGKVYLFVQSIDGTSSGLSGIITNQSTITPDTAATYDFGYDSLEISLLGGPSDDANLTAVNGFGLPMRASVNYDNDTTATVGYHVSGGAIASDIGTITNGAGTYTYSSGPLAGDFRLSSSPATADNTTSNAAIPFPASAWLPYIESLEGGNDADVILSGQFNGAADGAGVYHNAGYYAYQLSWVADSSASDGGNFWLKPLASSQIQGDIEISAGMLDQNIYSQTGTVTIYNDDGTTVFDAGMSTGANNQWGKILGQFFTGFTAGYYEASGTPLNPQATGTIDLSDNINWDPTYAFGNDSTIGNNGTAITGQTSDAYSKLFFDDSNSYGWSYSDGLDSQYVTGGPLLPVSEPDGGDVPAIDLTVYAPGEMTSGYTAPVIDNYIVPDQGGYAVPSEMVGGNNLVLDFLSDSGLNEGVDLEKTATITLSIMTGDTDGVPTWSTVTFDGAAQSGGQGDGLGLWQAWTITGSAASGYTASVTQANGAAIPQSNGSMVINGLPTAATAAGVPNVPSWYQITVGAGTSYAKTYNLYLETGENGYFLNPNYAGQSGSLAVDGLARITPPATAAQYINTATVVFSVGSTVTYNPDLAVENAGSVNNVGVDTFPAIPPTAPVVGTIGNGGAFEVISGQVNSASNTITTTVSSGLAFGWTGDNPAPYVTNGGTVTTDWIGAYTNKANAGDTVEVTISNASHHSATISAQADIDGGWQTTAENIELGNGTYKITMQDFVCVSSSVNSGGTTITTETLTPVTSASDPLILTVDNPDNSNPNDTISIPCFRAGTTIATPRGPVAVEELRLGDTVSTADGAVLPILWIGHRTVDCSRHLRPEQVWPVRITAGAFAPGAPTRDLFLSPDHAVHAGGVLIPVKHLVNGTTVVQMAVETVTYLHIELERHQIVLAEGLAVETYLDSGDRGAFANGPGATMLHPAWGREARDIGLVMDALGYAPLQVAGGAVETVRRLLAERAGRSIAAA